MRRTTLCLLALVLFLGVPRQSQAQTITNYVVKVFNQGAAAPLTSTTLAASAFACGVTPKLVAGSGTTTNPSKIVFDDPSNPTGADCVYQDNGTGPILSLPFGSQVYVVAIDAVNAAGTSPDSQLSNPFAHPGTVASAPTGVRVGR